jgi:hypothetical protein
LFILAAEALGVLLPPVDALDQLVANCTIDRTARKQMLCTVDLRRLGQDGSAAVPYQQIHRRAERRIGADTRVAIGASALQAQGDVAGRYRLALHFVGFRQQLLDTRNAFLHGLARAARLLNRHGLQLIGALQALRGQQIVDLIRLATRDRPSASSTCSGVSHSLPARGAALQPALR